MKPWKGLALAVFVGLILGAGPLGALYVSQRSEIAGLKKDRDACLETLATAQKQAMDSDKGTAELARKPLSAIADRAVKVKPRVAYEGPEEIAVVAVKKDDVVPFDGGLFGRVKFAQATKAMEDVEAFDLRALAAEKKQADAEIEALGWKLKEQVTRKSRDRWIKKGVSLALGSGVAAWGLAKDKPWIAGAGLTVGLGGAILF